MFVVAGNNRLCEIFEVLNAVIANELGNIAEEECNIIISSCLSRLSLVTQADNV